jgi:hypothetical protein
MTLISNRPARTDTAGPAAPRPVGGQRMQRSWVFGGIALILLAGLAAVFVWRQFVQPHAYLAVNVSVPVGQKITSADLIVVRINDAPGLQPIPASDASRVVGKTAVITLLPGTLLVNGDITSQAVPAVGQQLIGLGLSVDQLPSQPIKPGTKVLLVETPDSSVVSSAAGSSAAADDQNYPATVNHVGAADKQNNVVVDVLVDQSDGPTIAALADANRIYLIVVAG